MNPKKFLFTLAILSVPVLASAQPATPTSKYQWEQDATDLATASSATYKHYSDGAVTGTALTNVTCTGAPPTFTCIAPIPLYTQGNHTVQLTAGNAAGESAKSTPLSFAFVTVPAVPKNLRIIAESLKIRNKLAKQAARG